MIVSAQYDYLPIKIETIKRKIKEFPQKINRTYKKTIQKFLSSIDESKSDFLLPQEWLTLQILIKKYWKIPLFQYLDHELCFDFLCSLDPENFDKNKKFLELLITKDEKQSEKEKVFTGGSQLVHYLFAKLNQNDLLTSETFNQTLQITTTQIKPLTSARVEKINRKASLKPRSKLIIQDQDEKKIFYIEHIDKEKDFSKHYSSGSYGTVKLLYGSQSDLQPTHILKRSSLILPSDLIEQKDLFFQEASLSKLMDDQTQIFSRSITKEKESFKLTYHKLYIVQSYIPGVNLGEIEQSKFKEIKPLDRILFLEKALIVLVTLHDNFYCHNDISLNNLRIDLKQQQLHLFDFGLSRHMDVQLNPYRMNFSDDVYKMGTAVAFLFPELYAITSHRPLGQATQIKFVDLTAEEKLIIELINAMVYPEEAYRCTAKDALAFIQGLKTSEINPKELLQKTIHRKSITEYDIFHGCFRPNYISKQVQKKIAEEKINSMDDQSLLLKILMDKSYWQSKHSNGLQLPKGIQCIHEYLKSNEGKDISWEKIKLIALQQLSTSINTPKFFKRDPLTNKFYEY